MEKNLEKELRQESLVSNKGVSTEAEDNGLTDFANFNARQILYLTAGQVLTAFVGIFGGWAAYKGIIEGINYLK